MPVLSSFGGLSAIGRGQRAGGRKRVEITISANTSNYVLNTAKVAGYEPGNTDVILTINSGVVIGSTSTGSFAFDVDTSWAALDTLTVVNNGTIAGRGGDGGVGDGESCFDQIEPSSCGRAWRSSYTNGTAAGPAFRAQRPLSISNFGVIGGGGGGGRGVGGNINGAGGGAGAGGGGPPGTNLGYCFNSACNDPTGSYSSGGAWGGDGTFTTPGGGSSSGGALGSQGGNNGGAAGACTSGNANITWIAVGTRYGALN